MPFKTGKQQAAVFALTWAGLMAGFIYQFLPGASRLALAAALGLLAALAWVNTVSAVRRALASEGQRTGWNLARGQALTALLLTAFFAVRLWLAI